MGNVTVLAAAPVTGYVEAVTSSRVLGWAWGPGEPSVAATVELRIDGSVVATALADRHRADLASSGIGDGRHAFDVAIPERFIERASELRVFARVGDGDAHPIGLPEAAEAFGDQVSRMLKGLNALVGSQRLMHRTLQEAISSAPESGRETAASLSLMAAEQAAIAEQLNVLEKFIVRLDERLPQSTGQAPSERWVSVPGPAWWALAVAGSSLAVSVVGFVRSIGG